jgi:hypothetical protein
MMIDNSSCEFCFSTFASPNFKAYEVLIGLFHWLSCQTASQLLLNFTLQKNFHGFYYR